MKSKTKRSNFDLYAHELFDIWTTKEKLDVYEDFLLTKYLTDPSKSLLEAGTGGGRIAFRIEDKGLRHIDAFEIVPGMVEHARTKAKKLNSNIQFHVADATSLVNFKSDSFDYLVYIQQMLCYNATKELFREALQEAYRIAKKDAIFIFSFLDYDARIYNKFLDWIVQFLSAIRGEKIPKQYLPWLKIDKKINWKLFSRYQPLSYWVKREQVLEEMKAIGFKIIEVKNQNQLQTDEEKREGILYIVCTKP